jgi:integral membrane protein (TIGR01906 family)
MNKKYFIYLESFLIFVIILTLCITIVSSNKGLYPKVKEYNKEEILALDNLVNYLNNNGDLNNNYFNQREIYHMQDVKDILNRVRIILTLSIISAIILNYKLNKKQIRASLIKGSIISIIFTFLISVISLLSFGKFFSIFHNIFFKAGTWLFSNTDMLIRLFPLEFFLWILLRILLINLIISSLILLYLIIKKYIILTRKNNKK